METIGTIHPSVLICDLDGTLAPSKSSMEKSMSDVLGLWLTQGRLAVVSGGSFDQFVKQFVSSLSVPVESLSRLYLFPTNGSACFVYDTTISQWKSLYNEVIPSIDRKNIIESLWAAIQEVGISTTDLYGDQIEDRGGQVTFSGLGQRAPIEKKKDWDPDHTKRQKIVALITPQLPDFEIRIGGMTSIDVTKKGMTKAYAIERVIEIMHVSKKDIVYIGDALYPGGNDESAKSEGVTCVQVADPAETERVIASYIQ